jgi:hypothetical protein
VECGLFVSRAGTGHGIEIQTATAALTGTGSERMAQ